MGFSFATFFKIAELVAPIALTAAGVPMEVVPLVVHSIQLAETHPVSGEEKKSIALDAVTTGLMAVNVAKPGTVDVPQLTSTVSDGINLAIQAINAAKNIPVQQASV